MERALVSRRMKSMGQGRNRCRGAGTSLACGLKLSRVAVLPIASYRAGTDLDHVAGIGP